MSTAHICFIKRLCTGAFGFATPQSTVATAVSLAAPKSTQLALGVTANPAPTFPFGSNAAATQPNTLTLGGIKTTSSGLALGGNATAYVF